MYQPFHLGPIGYLLVHWLVLALALFLTSKIVPGFRLRNFSAALIACLILTVANYTVRWVLIFLTFPLYILTLGLFTFVIDAILLKLCAAIMNDFKIASWTSAIIGAFVVWAIGVVLHQWIV